MTEYKIRELCGDWALDIPMGNDIVVLYFNSRVNAEMVKNVLEWENAHPNEAIPYNTPAIDHESLRLKANWIYDGKIDEDGNLVCRCSRCEHGDRHSPGITVPYCWFCGAKMTDDVDMEES